MDTVALCRPSIVVVKSLKTIQQLFIAFMVTSTMYFYDSSVVRDGFSELPPKILCIRQRRGMYWRYAVVCCDSLQSLCTFEVAVALNLVN